MYLKYLIGENFVSIFANSEECVRENTEKFANDSRYKNW